MVAMETFKCENANLLFFRFVVKMSVKDHIMKKPLFADAAWDFFSYSLLISSHWETAVY